MGKKIISLAVVLVLAFSLFGCTGKKAELTPEREDYIRSLTDLGVSLEVYSRYGLQPVVSTEKITAYGDSDEENGFQHMTFHTEGSYTVKTETDEVYSGTFKVEGHIEAHGGGPDRCEITEPRNGLSVLPEQSPEAAETTAQTEETAGTTIYQPLAEYVYGNSGNLKAVIEPPIECDLNDDGYPELCANVTLGNNISTKMVVVYDVQNDCGYMLNERRSYDYTILGASDDTVAVARRRYEGNGEEHGVITIQKGELVFIDEDTYRANGGV